MSEMADLETRALRRLREGIRERSLRAREALRLYEPTPVQDAFHRSTATERLVIGGSRAGKSLACYVELARAALGVDPYQKYPTDRPLTIWLLCYEEGNIGRTAYRMLFKPGAFQIIKDRATGRWRTWHPWDPDDKSREKEARPAGPLIPRRHAPDSAFSWIKKRQRIFRKVELWIGDDHPMNGTEIYVFSSASEVPMGDPVDLIMIDEDIQYADHYPELQARLSDRKGRLIWSAKPKTKNQAMINLSRRCDEQAEWQKPDAQQFRLVYSQNPYMDPEEVSKRLRNWTPAERRIHDYGEFALDLQLLYPEFDYDLHAVPWLGEDQRGIDVVLGDGSIPEDWTRIMSVDPGFAVTAAVFLAIPPPLYGDFLVAYDELYMRECTPQSFADAVAQKAAGQQFYAFIIDDHGSRQRTAVTGKTVRQHYTEELAERQVRSRLTGSGFIKGSDDVAGRTMAVRRLLVMRKDGTSKFRILRGTCPNLLREFRTCRRRIVQGDVKDTRVDRDHHALDALEYAAAFGPHYVRPERTERDVPPVVAEYRRWQEAERRYRPVGIYLGPGKGR